MPDQHLTDLTEETSPDGTDLVFVVADPGGTPLNRKVQIGNLADTIATDPAFTGTYGQRTTHVVKADGTANYTTLAAAITAATAGDTIELKTDLAITAAVTVNKTVTIDGNGHTITQGTAATAGLTVTASGVTLKNLGLAGVQAAAVVSAENAIVANGTVGSPILGLSILDCTVSEWGMNLIHMEHVRGFIVEDCDLSAFGYAGVIGISVHDGFIVNNTIADAIAGADSYGIALTRYDLANLVTAPRSDNVLVAGNKVSGVPWEGIDTHGGKDITICDNTVLGCEVGIAVIGADALGDVPTWGSLDVVVANNIIDSQVTDGSAGAGISFTGAQGTLGSTVEASTGAIIGNVIRGHGDQANAVSGGIYTRDTQGVAIRGNVLIEASPHAIALIGDNYGADVSGNTIIDQWSNTVSAAGAIYVPSGYVTGVISGNVHSDAGNKAAATYKNARGINVTSVTGLAVESSGNYLEECTLPVNGVGPTTKFHYAATFVEQAKFSGSAAAPGVSFGIDGASGFYALNVSDFALVVAGARRLRFFDTSVTIEDGYNVSLGGTSGTMIGLGVAQKLGFHGTAATIQRTGAAQAAVVTTGATLSAYGFTEAQANAIITLVNELRAALVAKGLIKGSA